MKIKSSFTLAILLLFCALMGTTTTNLTGQSLVTLLPGGTIYSNAQLLDIQKVANDPLTADYRLVELGVFENFENNGFLTFTLPGLTNDSYTGLVEIVENDPYQGTVWSGSIVGDPGSYFAFGRNPNTATGYVKLQDQFYVFWPMGGNWCILTKQETEAYPDEICPVQTEPPSENEVDECEIENNACPTTVDVLLLITPEARAYLNTFDFWGLAIFSSMANASINQAFQNSDIPNKQVKIKAVQNFSLTAGYTTPPEIGTDLDNLVADATAQTLRSQYKADVVIMLTNQVYFTADSVQVFGAVKEVKTTSGNAYGIVEVPYMIAPRWTLAHEVGHFLGARHNRTSNGGNDDTDICAHARRFDDGADVERRTILAGLSMEGIENNPFSGEGRILYYSNPEVEFNEANTGTGNDDNAKAIRNTACGVGAFMNSSFGVLISGPSHFCEGGEETEPQTYEAVVNAPGLGEPGHPPYTYEWRWSTSPSFGSSTVLGTAQSITINSPLNCPQFFLRVRVTGSDNVVVTHTRVVKTNFCDECDGQFLMGFDPGSIAGSTAHPFHPIPAFSNEADVVNSIDNQELVASVIPNPSDGNLTLNLSMAYEAEVRVKILSAGGAVVSTMDLGYLQNGNHAVPFSLVSCSPGVYFCEILAGNLATTLKIVVLD